MSYRADLGTGIYLDDSLDFQVDNSGDIKAAKGIDELQKDLALQGIFAGKDYIGEPPSENTDQSLKDELTNRFEADARVENVQKSNIEIEWAEDRKSISVKIPVKVDDTFETIVVEI